jgi:hypothetical protein
VAEASATSDQLGTFMTVGAVFLADELNPPRGRADADVMTTETQTTFSPISKEDERRRTKRRPHVCEAWIRSPTDSDESRTEVISLDLSRHGVGFESNRPLPQGCFFWIELGFGDQVIAQEIRISSCVEIEEIPGRYRVGAEFC